MLAPADAALLERSPEEAVRRLALAFLGQAADARRRLDDPAHPADAEALHDFRVGIRRLRSAIKAYGPHLEGSIGTKLRRELRRLAQSTNPGRDAEVQIEWLKGQSGALRTYQRQGLAWLLARLEERKREAYEGAVADVSRDFDGVAEKLRRRLSVYRAEIRLGGDGRRGTFREVVAAVLGRHLVALEAALGQVATAADVEPAHEARIEAKRLRYLLEPLADELPGTQPPKGILKRLKTLQDLLGELHDAHVLEEELGRALADAAVERAHKLLEINLQEVPDEQLVRAERRRARESGLLALARRNRARRDELFAAVESEWLGGRGGAFFREVEELAAALAAPDAAGEAAPPEPS